MMILDANAIVKLLFDEIHSEKAKEIVKDELRNDGQLLAPDIIVAESLTAIWKRYTFKKEITEEKYFAAIKDTRILCQDLHMLSTDSLAQVAVELGNTYKSYKLTIYDALYMAASRINYAKLLTFDENILKINQENETGIQIVKWYE